MDISIDQQHSYYIIFQLTYPWEGFPRFSFSDRNLETFIMAEAFLDGLLQTTNITQSDDQNCVICLQETGKISRETGYVELLVRLPCTHLVGSGCISRWLTENNSCPICRREFFPAQPRPYLEHGVMDGQGDEDE